MLKAALRMCGPACGPRQCCSRHAKRNPRGSRVLAFHCIGNRPTELWAAWRAEPSAPPPPPFFRCLPLMPHSTWSQTQRGGRGEGDTLGCSAPPRSAPALLPMHTGACTRIQPRMHAAHVHARACLCAPFVVAGSPRVTHVHSLHVHCVGYRITPAARPRLRLQVQQHAAARRRG